MSTETFCSTSLHQKKWTKKICNVYLYINSRTNPYGFRTCCFLDVFSSLSQHFSHRDAVRNYLKWVFTSRTKNHYEVHLGCAANFLIKVNFLPCVFLLQKLVSSFLSSTCIHVKHNCSATSQNSESRNTHAFGSGPGSSPSTRRATGEYIPCSSRDFNVFCFPSGVGWECPYHPLLQLSSRQQLLNLHPAVRFACICVNTSPELLYFCTLFQEPHTQFLLHCTQLLLKLFRLELDPFNSIRSDQ